MQTQIDQGPWGALLQAKGVTLFGLVDHSGEAAKVGMTMRPTKSAIERQIN